MKSVLVALESHFEVNFKRAPKVNTTDMISCHVSYSRFTERATMNGSAKTVLLMYRDMNWRTVMHCHSLWHALYLCVLNFAAINKTDIYSSTRKTSTAPSLTWLPSPATATRTAGPQMSRIQWTSCTACTSCTDQRYCVEVARVTSTDTVYSLDFGACNWQYD